MVASFATISSSAYYTRQAQALSYYADKDATGFWLRGHETLGIVAGAPVTAIDFDRVCAGLDASGKTLIKPGARPRMLSVDITLSSPKAFSAYLPCADSGTRQSLIEAEAEVLESMARLIEAEIPLSRRGHGGNRREQAKFTAAVFTHNEARPERHADGVVFADPQRHHHLCIPSIAQREDGTWGGIDSVALRSWKKALGAVFRLELASALQARGFVIEHADDEWKWSIGGVPKAVTTYFSARRAALEEELADAGLTSGEAPALAASINATERRAKQDLSLEQLTSQWHAAIRRLGYEPEQITAAALEAGKGLEHEPTDLARFGKDRLAKVPQAFCERQATFSRRELIESAANALVGTGAGLDDVIAGADSLISEGRVLVRAETRDGPIYTTPEMLAAEKALVALVRRNATADVIGPSREIEDQLLSGTSLNAEQHAVVRAATSGKRTVLVQGSAGTGKSTTLKTITQAWQMAGYDVVGAAVAWQAAHTLGTDLGIKARAIDSWLKTLETGQRPFTDKTCLLVEEAGLQSTHQTLRLLEAVDRAGPGTVVVMVGDENQLLPIGAGHAMRLIRESIGATRIETVVRQHEAWARQAPKDFVRGKARKALDEFAQRDRIHMHDGSRATVEALADRWDHESQIDPARDVLVTAKTNAEVRALSAAIRNRLRDRGALAGPDIIIEAADASGNRNSLRLAIGDDIRFLRRNDDLGVVNGSKAKIVSIGQDIAGAVRIEAERDGERITFAPADVADSKGRARLAHGYAVTLFQAQGQTVDRALVLMSARFDRHDAYVSSSRGRERTDFFLDTRSLDREIEPDAAITSETERVEGRMAYLASRLARQSVKTNALDFIPEQDLSPSRQKEFSHEL